MLHAECVLLLLPIDSLYVWYISVRRIYIELVEGKYAKLTNAVFTCLVKGYWLIFTLRCVSVVFFKSSTFVSYSENWDVLVERRVKCVNFMNADVQRSEAAVNRWTLTRPHHMVYWQVSESRFRSGVRSVINQRRISCVLLWTLYQRYESLEPLRRLCSQRNSRETPEIQCRSKKSSSESENTWTSCRCEL